MNSFKTPAGTELPLLKLQGKDYLLVAYRLVWFREQHPLGRIDTQFLELKDTYAVCKATVSVLGKDGSYVKLADATKREDRTHFKDFVEKSETGSIGRALALCGFGTAFAVELDEAERLVDSPTPGRNGDEYLIPFGKFKGRTLEQVGEKDLSWYLKYIQDRSQEEQKELSGVVLEFVQKAQEFLFS